MIWIVMDCGHQCISVFIDFSLSRLNDMRKRNYLECNKDIELCQNTYRLVLIIFRLIEDIRQKISCW